MLVAGADVDLALLVVAQRLPGRRGPDGERPGRDGLGLEGRRRRARRHLAETPEVLFDVELIGDLEPRPAGGRLEAPPVAAPGAGESNGGVAPGDRPQA